MCFSLFNTDATLYSTKTASTILVSETSQPHQLGIIPIAVISITTGLVVISLLVCVSVAIMCHVMKAKAQKRNASLPESE